MPPKAEDAEPQSGFRVGAFEIAPDLNRIIGPDGEQSVEPKMMQVLLLLVRNHGRVVSREEILREVWTDTFVGDEVVWRAVSELRKVFGDDPRNPRHIETVPRKGYRWIARDGLTGETSANSLLGVEMRGSQWRNLFPIPLILLAVLLSIGLFLLRDGNEVPSDAREGPVWVLIAEAEGNAGEEYGLLLRHGLEIALGQSRRVRLAAPDRVFDALRMMRLARDTPVTVDVGREICLRDGKIDYLVGAGVDRDQDELLMRVLLIDPESGNLVAVYQEEADREKGVFDAVQSLSDWTRSTLGEAIPEAERSAGRLERATTGSLEALRLYGEAMRLGHLWEWGSAERLLRRAIEVDPDFASAHIMLAWAIRNQIPPLERSPQVSDYSEPARTAFELSEGLPEPERLWIEGSYYYLLGEPEKSVDPYRALVALHPDHFWAAHNLSVHFRTRVHHSSRSGQIESAIKYLKAEAELRPNDLYVNSFAAQFLGFELGRFEEAEPFVLRARVLGQTLSPSTDALPVDLRLFPEILMFEREGNPAPLLSALARIRSSMEAGEFEELAGFYRDLGQMREAESLISLEPNLELRLLESAYSKCLSGDEKSFKSIMKTWASDPANLEQAYPFRVVLLVRAGLVAEADRALTRVPPAPWSRLDEVETARGLVLIASGNLEEGRALVETALECPLSREMYSLAADFLAAALEKVSEKEAVHTLERALRRRFIVGGGTSSRWPLYTRLLRLYEHSGEDSKRAALARQVRESLKAADEDHPLLRATQFLEAP